MGKHLTPTQTESIPTLFAEMIADGIKKPDAIKRIAKGLGKDVERIRQILRQSNTVIAIPELQTNVEFDCNIINEIERLGQAKAKDEVFENQIEDLLEIETPNLNYDVLALNDALTSVKPSSGTPKERITEIKSRLKQIREWKPEHKDALLLDISDRLKNIESKVNAPFVHTPDSKGKVELTKETTTEFFLSDVHWHPEHSEGHDPASWRVCEKAIETIQPDIIYWGGDVVDCYAPSRYEGTPRLKTPEAYDGEIAYAKQKLKEVRELAPNARWIWLTGNHEERVKKSVFSNASWLLNKLENLEADLQLEQFDCSFVEDGHKIGKLSHFHGHNLAGGGQVNPAKNKFLRLLDNVIYGHLHTFATWYQRKPDGGYYGAFGNGTFQWLQTGYAFHPNWQQGFSCNQYAKSGLFNVDQILIHKPSVWSPKAEAIYQGVHYKVDLSQ